MRFAVVHDHAHILQREAGYVTGLDDLSHALLNRGNELAWDRAALDRIHKLESFAARQRLDTQIDFAELACSARLLLVTIVSFSLRHDRLAEWNGRRPRVELEFVLRCH